MKVFSKVVQNIVISNYKMKLINFTNKYHNICIIAPNIKQDEDPDVVNYGVQPAAVANEMEFLRNFMTLNEDERMLIGHDFKSFIKGCTFRGKNCLSET